MWPWGHLAVAYLSYVVYTRLGDGDRQTAATLLAVAVGSQFPDLIDKPLAWTFGVLPSGRSLGHSLLTFVVVAALCLRVAAWYRKTDVGVAFAIGWLTHLFSDLPPSALVELAGGDLGQLVWMRYLAYPLVPPPPYANDSSFLEHFLAFRFEPFVLFQFALFALAVLVWVGEGRPGLGTVRLRLRSVLAPRD